MRWLRRRMGLSQAAFAARIGMAQSSIGDMETGYLAILPETERRVRALVAVPDHLCGNCLCWIADGTCGCAGRAA